MFRVVGTLVVAASILAGPRLCCCEFAPLGAACVAGEESSKTTSSRASARDHDCCHSRSEQARTAEPTAAQETCHHEKDSSCPCGQDPIALRKVAKTIGKAPDDWANHAKPMVDAVASLDDSFVAPILTLLKTHSESTAFPYLDGRDILRALCILRC